MKLEVKNLKKSFGSKEVLKGISFTCNSGGAIGLLGRNGAGKTTTIRTVIGIISRDEGEVLLDGEPFKSYYPSIGYLPEERGLYPKLKLIDQMTYFASLRGITEKQAKKNLDFWLERMDMTEYRNSTFETLSKGNQQKIQLILSLLHDPKILILDEPFSGLDPVNAQMLKDVVIECIKGDKIVIFSSHQMNFVEEFCEEVLMINKGEIVLDGNLNQIKRGYERKKLYIRARGNPGNITEDLQIPGVLQTEPFNDGYLLHLDTEDRCKDVFTVLHEKGHDVDNFNLVELTLNDIFIKKVGDDE